MIRFLISMFFFCSSLSYTQSDTMFVLMKDGSLRRYPVSRLNSITFSKEGAVSVRDNQMMQSVLASFALHQNFPNPFNPTTTIQYSIPEMGPVNINIHDIQGRLIRTLQNGVLPGGNHTIVWDSKNSEGNTVSSGTYFCQILFQNMSLMKKLVFIK